MCRQFLAVVLATLSLITLVQSVWYDNDTCSTPVSCDCKYIDQNLEEFCKDAENWGEMSGCDVALTGLNYSVSWCPKFIRNTSCVSHMKLRVNFLEIKTPKQFESGVADVVAYIPGFDKPIFNKTWDGYTCEKLRKELESHLPVPLPCPFSFESVKKFVPLFQYGFTFSNPLQTIVPAGSYNLLSNVTTSSNEMFMCIDGWLEFGI